MFSNFTTSHNISILLSISIYNGNFKPIAAQVSLQYDTFHYCTVPIRFIATVRLDTVIDIVQTPLRLEGHSTYLSFLYLREPPIVVMETDRKYNLPGTWIDSIILKFLEA